MNIFRFAVSWLNPLRFIVLYHSGAGHQQRQQASSDFNAQSGLTKQAQGTLGQFEGPVQQSPFYKALLTQGTEGTSNAYNQARSNMRARANQAGFGYTQPVEQGGENQLDAAEASSLARVPDEAMLEATGPALSAAGQTGQMGMGYGSQGVSLLNPNAQNSNNNNQWWLRQGAQGLSTALLAI